MFEIKKREAADDGIGGAAPAKAPRVRMFFDERSRDYLLTSQGDDNAINTLARLPKDEAEFLLDSMIRCGIRPVTDMYGVIV